MLLTEPDDEKGVACDIHGANQFTACAKCLAAAVEDVHLLTSVITLGKELGWAGEQADNELAVEQILKNMHRHNKMRHELQGNLG